MSTLRGRTCSRLCIWPGLEELEVSSRPPYLTCARTHMFERNESDFRRTEFSDGRTLLHLSQRLIQQCTVRHVEVKPR